MNLIIKISFLALFLFGIYLMIYSYLEWEKSANTLNAEFTKMYVDMGNEIKRSREYGK